MTASSHLRTHANVQKENCTNGATKGVVCKATRWVSLSIWEKWERESDDGLRRKWREQLAGCCHWLRLLSSCTWGFKMNLSEGLRIQKENNGVILEWSHSSPTAFACQVGEWYQVRTYPKRWRYELWLSGRVGRSQLKWQIPGKDSSCRRHQHKVS